MATAWPRECHRHDVRQKRLRGRQQERPGHSEEREHGEDGHGARDPCSANTNSNTEQIAKAEHAESDDDPAVVEIGRVPGEQGQTQER